jgi:hypothetical protein
MPVVDIDPYSDDDKSTIIFVSASSPKAGAGKCMTGAGKSSKKPPKGFKITPKNVGDLNLTMRQIIELKPAKSVIREFFKQRIDKAVAMADEVDTEDEEEEKPRNRKK